MRRKVKELFTDNRSPFADKNGIALLPVIMILLVVASLIAIGVTMFGPVVQRGKATETKDIVEAAVDSVISWATANKRLPKYTPTDEFTPAVKNPNDSFGKALVYLYDNNLTDTTTGGLCGRITTSYPSGCDETTCAAFIIISGGDDFTVNSTPATSQSFPASITLSGSDIYRVVTLAELKSRASCYGLTGGRLAILNNELPNGRVGQSYNATVYADGGVPSYSWCIETSSGSLPNGISSGTIPVFATGGCASATFVTSSTVQLTASPVASPPGTTNISFFLKDSNNNIVQKTLRLKVKTGAGDISFDSGIPGGGFVTSTTSPTGAYIDTTNNTVILGSNDPDSEPDHGTTVGCVWYQTSQTLAGKIMRAYLNFNILEDTDSRSKNYGDGFTYTVMTANNPTTTCGTQGDGMGYHTIPGKSVAVEFDTYRQSSKNDPISSMTVYNHVAIIYNGSNVHGTSPNDSCLSDACVRGPGPTYSATWLEDGVTHNARIELDATAGVGGSAYINVWIDCTSCDDVNSNFTGSSAQVTDSFTLDSTMTQVIIGFTEGTAGQMQYITLSNFNATFASP